MNWRRLAILAVLLFMLAVIVLGYCDAPGGL